MATRTLLDETDIAGLIDRLAAQIIDAGERSVVLVGIREGGDVLAERLAQHLGEQNVSVEFTGALDITLYRDDFGHRAHWPDVRASDVPGSIEDRCVVLVDDVIFTGRTIRAALNALLDYGRPRRVLLAVLIDRGFRQLPVQPDIVGKFVELPRDELCLVRFREQGASRDAVTLSESG